MNADMAKLGPQAWSRLHAWADDLKAEVGDTCGCGDFAIAGMRAFHDLVNAELGKPVLYPEDLKHMAEAYKAAADSMKARQEADDGVRNGLADSLASVGNNAALPSGDHHVTQLFVAQEFQKAAAEVSTRQERNENDDYESLENEKGGMLFRERVGLETLPFSLPTPGVSVIPPDFRSLAVTTALIRSKAQQRRIKVLRAEDIAPVLVSLQYSPQEWALLMFLNTQNVLVGVQEISLGTRNEGLVPTDAIIRTAVALNASGVMMAHNHPSGDSHPSPSDENVTRRLRDALKLVDINLLDSFVVGDDKYRSIVSGTEILLPRETPARLQPTLLVTTPADLQPAMFQNGQNSHVPVTLSQAFMERVMAVPREQLGFGLGFPLPPGTTPGTAVVVVPPLRRPPVAVNPARPAPTTLKPYPFQAEGIAWLKDKDSALLADDMGLGKTNQAIAWGADRQPALVIVPAAVQYNWQDEIHKWRPGDTTLVLESGEDIPPKLPMWTIASYGQVKAYLSQMQEAGFRSLIIDEAHYIKSMDAQRTRNVLDLVAPAKPSPGARPITSRLAVTGTPITNRPPELFPLLVFLGKASRSQESSFLERYTLRASSGGKTYFVGYQHLDELHASIKPFTLRRLKRDVLTQLPPKVYRPVYVGITNAAEYHKAEVDFLEWLRVAVGEGAVNRVAFSVRAQILVQLNYLRQLAARGKVKAVADFLKPCDETGHKVLVFSNFLEVLEDLHDEKGGIIYTGATPRSERNELVKRFQSSPSVCFFFGSIGAAGVGITLTAADRAVFVDLPWTPAAKSQAEDRAHRIGQTKPVEIVPFLARGTVDERIMTILAEKEKVISQVIDGFAADRAALESVTTQLMADFMSMAKAGQTPTLPPSYIPDTEDVSEEEAEELQGWAQTPDDYGSRCRDPETGYWTVSELCPPIESIISPGRTVYIPSVSGTARTLALSADGLRQYEFELRVVEANALIPSHDPFTFVENPAFTQKLQPRLRDRAAAEIQVKRIAAQLSPDSLLTDFHTLDRGAPIAGPDMLVESGNGRAMGVVRAIQEFPENYAAYRKALLAKVPEYGLDASRLTHPVLVRVRITKLTPQERQAFVLEANTPAGLSRSAIEQARTDGEKITPVMLDSLDVAEGENIFDALRAPKNASFIRAFLGNVPDNERGQLLDAKGAVNMDGVRRAAQAIFVSAFGAGDAGMRLGEMAFESADLDVRSAINAVTAALGSLAKMEAMLRTRLNGSDLSLATDLAQAISVYAKIKNDPALTVEKYLAQAQMLERELSPFGEALLTTLHRNRRSAKRMSTVLRTYADMVIALPPEEQTGLFGPVELPPREALWGQALESVEEPVMVGAQGIEFRPLSVVVRERMQRLEGSIAEGKQRLSSKVNGAGQRLSVEELSATQREVKRAEEELEELRSEYGKPLASVPRGPYSSRIRWCNTKPDDQAAVMAWRPLRNLIYMGIGYQVAVEVCEAGFGGGQLQIAIGYPQEGSGRKGTLTSGQLVALRVVTKQLGALVKEVLTKDPGVLVFNVTLPGPEAADLVLKPQLPESEKDIRRTMPDPTLQPALFQGSTLRLSQSFLDIIVNSALATATSIGVAKALSASVVPGGVQPKPPQEEKPREATATVLSPAFVEGDQAQVDLGTLLEEIDEILKHPDTMGEVDTRTLRVTRT